MSTPGADTDQNIAIAVRHVSTRFGDFVVHEDVSLDIRQGEVFALAGPSGCGKSTLMREIVMLQPPAGGSIRVLGREVTVMDDEALQVLRRQCGVMFQHGALFSALTIGENIAVPLQEHTALSQTLIDELAAIKLDLVGLPADAAQKYPAEISGGMRKRAAIARALALDPHIVFLDEPTAGLDPTSSAGIDELIINLKQLLGLTVVVVTHDLDTLWRSVDRVAVLGEQRVLAVGSMEELSTHEHPFIREYFHGPRGRAARVAQ